MAGYLADRLRREKQALDDTSRQLRRARLETDDILRHLNSGLLTIDAQGYIIYYNRAAEKILGYPETAVRGQPCESVFAERMPELSETLLQALRKRQDRPRREISIVSPAGHAVPLGLSTSVLLEEQGEPRGVIAIFSDLTEAKAMEAKMRAADRLAAVGELSASIAHEIRNPLASISGSVEVLADELQLEGTNAQLMQLIVKESHRLSKILSDFLEYARLGRRTYDKVDLVHLINEVIDLVRHHASYREDIFIDMTSDESVIYVDGDADLYKQLLLNLALNACDALNGGRGQIIFTVVVHAGSDVVELYVQDTGPGMPPETLERIFEPFFSTKKQGTGLGLAIVHRICALMGLELNVDSREGQGTTFMVEFHRYHDHSPSDVQSQPAERPVSA
jgi:two-component system sensor histidine kinase PilS (NtrC family)